MRRLIGGLALLLTLAACDGQLPGATQPPTLAATVSIAEPSAVAPSPIAAELTPTIAVATATATPTPLPTATPGPSPTPEPAALIIATVEPRLKGALPSPDGALLAEVFVYPCPPEGDKASGDNATGEILTSQSLETLHVMDAATDLEYQIDSQVLNCGGLGAFGLEPLTWSADGQVLWYTTAREGGPDGACRPWARPMTRFDLAGWSSATLDQAAVSPDGAQVAGWQEGELVIYALDGGEIGRAAPAALPPNVGPIVWSPDGTALVYLQFTSYCGEAAGDSAVVLVDAVTFESRVLVTQSAPEFESVSWPEAGRLELSGLLDSGRWVLDLATNTLAPAP
ncbi:MAG: hypothetical protein KBG73_11660 [Candidatus Promineofilum sp.]|nr:hypothetical protein [Promineifilum sp.]